MLPQKRIRHRPHGFSLIELMIAISIFTVVIAGGFSCLKLGLNLIDNSRHHTRAAQIMQSEIERVRSLAWANLNALPRDETDISIPAEFADSSNASYSLKRSISKSGNVRKITLKVAWQDISGRSHAKTYVTQYTKGGLYDYIQ